MKARVESARSTLNQHVRLSIALFGLALAVLILFVPGSHANLTGSTFEGNDGNMLVDTAPNTDWVSFKNSPALVKLIDAPSGTGDNSFAGGTKENDTTVGLTTGSIPDKDDLLRAYAATADGTVGGQPASFLYLSWVRSVSNGDAHIDFELNKDGTTDWSGSTVNIKRSVGDLLISYDFVGNLNQVDVTSFTWNGSAWANQQDLSALGDAEGAVNVNGAINDEISGGSLGAGNFGEAAINLTATLNLPTDQPCGTFGSMFAKTRSSGSGGTAQLKDLILPQPIHVSTCGSIELKKHWAGPAGSTSLKIGKTQGASDVALQAVSGADGTTGAQQVVQGDYFVSESAVSGYTTTTSCFNDLNNNGTQDTGEPDVSVDGTGKVHVNTNDVVVCTITNTFTKLTPTVGTTLKNAANDATVANNASLPLGSGAYDTAQITGDGAFPLTGTVTFNFYASNNCSGTPVTESGVAVSGTSATSNKTAHLNLGAGNYSFNAQYLAGSDNAHNDSLVSSCEPFTVNQAQLSIGTTIHDANHGTIANNSSIPLGSVVHDTSQVGGKVGGFSPSGAVTFTIYPNLSCTNGTSIATSGSTESNGDQRSVDTAALGAGNYGFKATVAGDSNYLGATSDCEPFTVNQATPTLSTTVKDGQGATVDNANPAALGTQIHDTSTLGGAVGSFKLGDGTTNAPDGATVTYKFFSNNSCSGTSVAPDQTVTVGADGSVPNATALTLSPGSYSYLATYSGNANYTAKTADCEPFKVSQATPTLVTTVKDGQGGTVDNAHPAALGTVVHDTSVLGGSVGSFPLGDGTANAPNGATVTYEFFTTNDCSGSHTDQVVNVAANGTVPDASTKTLGAGSYSYKAVYSGNVNYTSQTAACEPFKVNQATPTLVTTVKDGQGGTVDNAHPAALGTAIHDTSTLGGSVGALPLGGVSDPATLTYEFFTTNDCSGTHTDQVVNVAADGSVPDASAKTLDAGSYSYLAVYSGNTNYATQTAACEPFAVGQITPTLVTTVKDGQGTTVDNAHPAALGTAIHDTSLLGGASGGFPLGGASDPATVTYEFFATNDCSGSHTDQVVDVAADGSVPDASSQTLGTGSYSYKAVYSGNTNYAPKTAACEPFKVSQATPTLVTTVKDGQGGTVDNAHPAALGTVVHDTSVLGGSVGSFPLGDGTANAPNGATVTYQFFTTNDCSGSHTDQVVNVAANGSVQDADAATLGAGSYSYLAVYSGNANYTAKTAACEPFTVSQAQLTMTTHVHDADHVDVTNGTVGLGSTVHDLSVVTGAVGGFTPTGAVTFVLYNSSSCTGEGAFVSAVGNESGNVRSADVMSLVPGNYGFKATVAGDANYLGQTGACEPFTVAQAPTTTLTAIHDANHNVVTEVALGSTVHDSATVTSTNSSATPTGNVNFTFYNSSTCSGEGTSAGSHALDSAGVADGSSTEGPLAAGSYGFKGSYVGDTNFIGSTGDCEPLTVDKGTPSAATTLHNASGDAVVANGTHVPFGSSIYDVATLSNGSGFPLSGSVTFNFYSSIDCTGTPVAQTGVSISGSTAQSSTHSNLNAGNYSFNAQYVAGNDTNHNNSAVSACEPFTVDKAAPTIATTLSASEVVIGTSVHDSAKLTGASSNAGGSVTYSVFDNNTCTPNTNTLDGGTVAVTNGNVPDSNALLFNTAGDFYWQAAYSGDANNAAATSPCTSEHLVVEHPAIAITKTPATQAVNSGGTATFTITVTNTGTVTLTNVTVTDPLSTNCAKTVGTLTPGQSTSYSCTQANVTAAFTNVATATGHPPVGPDVTASASANVTVNPPPPPPSSPPPATPAPSITDLAIVKTASNASVLKGSNVTYTLTVTNNGPTTDTNVQVADSLPAGVTYVSSIASQGSCSGTAVVQCNLGTMTVGQKVTITIVVNTVNTGTIVNTTTVVGALPESTLTNNTASVSINVTAPPAPKPAPKPFKPPVVKPKPKPVPPPCYAVVVAPKSLTVGKNAKLKFHVTAKNKGIKGVKVEVKGAGILKLSGRTDSAGKVTLLLHPKKPGIVLVKPASYKSCSNPRIGVIGAFTPPVTG